MPNYVLRVSVHGSNAPVRSSDTDGPPPAHSTAGAILGSSGFKEMHSLFQRYIFDKKWL